MRPLKPITIIGGGLAGLTLGIGLRQRGIPVTIREAGSYPRHRVCGEFISGRGQQVLERLGLHEAFLRAGATKAQTVALFLGKARSPVRALAPPALCLSRFTMDVLLARSFRESGGDLHEQEHDRASGEGVVQCAGRRAQPAENGWHWFGLKVHARNVGLTADLEMHGLASGYVGLCRLPQDEVNVCGLFRRRVRAGDEPHAWREIIRHGLPGTTLHSRLAGAVLDEGSFCAVAGLPLQPQRASQQAECRLGDALTMTPPVTGNGMSMAFEAAELAMAPLAAYSRGEISWAQARQTVARGCDTAFARRLAWAQWVQCIMFTPALHGRLGQLVLSWDWLWKLLFVQTRV